MNPLLTIHWKPYLFASHLYSQPMLLSSFRQGSVLNRFLKVLNLKELLTENFIMNEQQLQIYLYEHLVLALMPKKT